jgi:hypothetical protein
MKKTSILLASSIMILAVIVAIIGVTAAWFGNQYTYNGTVGVSSANPENNAIIVPDSTSDLPVGQDAVLAPARIKRGYILDDVLGTGGYDNIDVTKPNEALESVAVPVTVTFDFVYHGAPSNPDGITSKMQIELLSVTLQNPLAEIDDQDGDRDVDDVDREIYQSRLVNYREEFVLSMFVTTSDSSVMMFGTAENRYYTEKTKTVEGKKVTYYELNDDNYVDDDNDHRITFNIIPVTHTLNATIYFIHVDEQTPPELINAQLFLNFKVTFIAG